jgi:hypothetical protein
LQSSDPGFYNRTSQSHSGHTVEPAEAMPEKNLRTCSSIDEGTQQWR